MCTVTFIPGRDGIFLTSNRDEKKGRLPAIPPAVYQHASGKFLYPKDADAGGTWILTHENNHALVLLNGAFEYHRSNPPYRKSRGLILLEIADHDSPADAFENFDLDDIEPFTMIIFEKPSLYEARWDGHKKHFKKLDQSSPHIWSSATLYDKTISEKRESWFQEWIKSVNSFDTNSIIHFHQFTGEGDEANDLRMNREGLLATVSITSMHLTETGVALTYLDLRTEELHRQKMTFGKTMATR